MDTTTDPRVFGESALTLFEIFQKMEQKPARDGMVQYGIPIARQDMPVFIRAFERADAELRAEDRINRPPKGQRRTAGERRADAMLLLLTKTFDAVRTDRSAHEVTPNQKAISLANQPEGHISDSFRRPSGKPSARRLPD